MIKQMKINNKKIKFIDDKKIILKNIDKIKNVSAGNEKEIELKIKNSYYNIIALCGDEVVGFSRVVSEGLYLAVIMDVEVSKNFRGVRDKYGRTIGIVLIKNILKKLKKNLVGKRFVSICEYSEDPKVRKWFKDNFEFIEINNGWTELGTTMLAKDFLVRLRSN